MTTPEFQLSIKKSGDIFQMEWKTRLTPQKGPIIFIKQESV